MSSSQETLDIEHKHLIEVLQVNDFPLWAIKKGQNSVTVSTDQTEANAQKNQKFKGYTVVSWRKIVVTMIFLLP